MIALAALASATAPVWVPVGETYSRLRVFVDRSSIHDIDGHRRARVRIGAPGAIVGRIVLAYQDEEFDCAARRWRLIAFEARDAADQVVQRSAPGRPMQAMLPIVGDSIGGAVATLVCAAPLPEPR